MRFGSLRVRLPLVFLAGIILAGLVTTLIAVRLFRDFSHDQALAKLSREANGIAKLYAKSVNESYAFKNSKTSKDKRAPAKVTATSLVLVTGGDKIFFMGPHRLFPGQDQQPIPGLEPFPLKTSFDWISGKSGTFEFTMPGTHQRYYAVANPIVTGQTSTDAIGAIVVATRKTDVSARVYDLIERLALAGVLGLLVAGLLAGYLSHRIVRPVLQLSDAADAVARGEYDVKIPRHAPGELGHLSERFGEMALRLAEVEEMERNFLMSVSHELRTPLTAIRGHVSALREGVVADPAERTASLETVEREAQRLDRLVGDILDLAKLDTHRFTVTSEEVDMVQLVDQAYERFREEARRRSIDYRQEVRARPVITSDGDRVLQVVGNLLSNAFHATPDGGRISLELAQRNGTVHVAIEDNGPGIAPEMRERLFRPFVSQTGGGTGLGLAIAKELSAMLGGSLGLESEVGRGSRFELVLPAT
ncbi:MAG TPA: HAMP domain-containing sensor histidine kinase [Gaiellaceae bacterium]|jgi:signal transduction histidine kinase|nr:HAMP domain-containing sensor histidine kinase [Gaiellaceae bacterium]